MLNYDMADDTQPDFNGQARFIVFGVGGGGGNAVEHMIEQQVAGISFVAANTDLQALNQLSAPIKLQLGAELTRGLGAGADPEVGRQAAEGDEEAIRAVLSNHDMVFITAGMGGGTGTGAAPVIARIAKEMGVLTVAVVTTPFKREHKRAKIAQQGIEQLSQYVDSIITVPNQKLIEVYRGLSVTEAFAKSNDVLLYAVDGITRTVREPGDINIDFNDVKKAMTARGYAMMGIGRASGTDRAAEAAEKAIRSPLLDDLLLKNAKGVIVNIAAATVGMEEFDEVAEVIERIADIEEAEMFYGVVNDKSMPEDELHVTVIATGLSVNTQPEVSPVSQNQSAPADHVSAVVSQMQAGVPTSQPRTAVKPISVGDFLQRQQQNRND